MQRPVRKKQCSTKFDPNLYVLGSRSKRTKNDSSRIVEDKILTRGQERKKKQMVLTRQVVSSKIHSNTTGTPLKKKTVPTNKRWSVLRDKTNISDEMKDNGKQHDKLEENPSIKHKSINKKEQKVKKCNSNETERASRFKKRNGSRKTDVSNEESASDDTHRNALIEEKETKNKTTKKKFFKNKIPAVGETEKIRTTQKVTTLKNMRNSRQKKDENSANFISLRQTTLSESFKRGSLHRKLRPRKAVKNYKDSPDTTLLLKDNISLDKRNSFVLLEKIDIPKLTNKTPVYKSGQLPVKNPDDKESIYEFEFDINDPKEKISSNRNKRKKRVQRKAAPIRKRKVKLKTDETKKFEKIVEEPPENITINEEDRKNPTDQNYDENNELRMEVENKDERFIIEKKTSSQSVSLKKGEEIQSPKPRMSRVETLTGAKRVTYQPNLPINEKGSTKINPFRSTQSIFEPRHTLNRRDMMEHSLLNKSLSPIKNSTDNFNVASPWRSPSGNEFFSVKQVVQSTPRTDRNLVKSTLGFRQTERILENDENENTMELGGSKTNLILRQNKNKMIKPLGNTISNAENIHSNENIVKVGSNKTSSVLRQNQKNILGNRISNAENIQSNENIAKVGGSKISPLLRQTENKMVKPLGNRVSNIENIQSNVTASISKFVDENVFSRSLSLTENKENSGYGDRLYKSPIKNDKTIVTTQDSSNFNVRNQEDKNESMKNSDTENLPPTEESKILRQSNLNSFLNINDMPESTTITTKNGLFGDAHSTPAVNFQSRKIQTQASVQNCFGFDDDISDGQVSPIKFDEKQSTTPVKKLYDRLKRRVLPTQKKQSVFTVVKPARISLGEIKNTLYQREGKKFENTDNKKINEPIIDTNKNDVKEKVDTISDENSNTDESSDTLDVRTDSVQENEAEKSSNKVELFADLEPVHFTKPPRWSYAKKRPRIETWSSVDNDDSEDEELLQKPVLKKKRLARVQQVDDKKIDEWVKSVNETFQEIDDFDLVIEKS